MAGCEGLTLTIFRLAVGTCQNLRHFHSVFSIVTNLISFSTPTLAGTPYGGMRVLSVPQVVLKMRPASPKDFCYTSDLAGTSHLKCDPCRHFPTLWGSRHLPVFAGTLGTPRIVAFTNSLRGFGGGGDVDFPTCAALTVFAGSCRRTRKRVVRKKSAGHTPPPPMDTLPPSPGADY